MSSLRCVTLLAKSVVGVQRAAIVGVRTFSTTNAREKFLSNSPNRYLDKTVLNRYRQLKYNPNKVQATYLWIDGTGENVRLKDRILDKAPTSVNDLPLWEYCGSATYQAVGDKNSDRKLVPRTIYRDPFKVGENDVIVLCDTYKPDGKPTESNNRHLMQDAINKTLQHEPWFGIEQEYSLLDINNHPFGWPECGFPAPQGPYYCGVGANRVYARDLAEAHTLACLYAGIDFAGTNAEAMPAQWEYQIGPSPGMKAADDLWVSRYILWRIAEELGIVVTFHPKPVKGLWNGAGAHTNFSTKEMREEGGIKAIKAAIKKLSHQHDKHIKVYDPKGGAYNAERLIGAFETSPIDKFSWGVADRGSSIRIKRSVANEGKGYLEDRRPSSNSDPYAVCNAILTTTLID